MLPSSTRLAPPSTVSRRREAVDAHGDQVDVEVGQLLVDGTAVLNISRASALVAAGAGEGRSLEALADEEADDMRVGVREIEGNPDPGLGRPVRIAMSKQRLERHRAHRRLAREPTTGYARLQ